MNTINTLFVGSLAAGMMAASVALADDVQLDYPFSVQYYEFEDQRQSLKMAYMDLAPEEGETEDAPVALLLHGKNFCSAYWEETAAQLSAHGYRVIMPDQIGFCRSTLPEHYQYTFHQLAANTAGLLDELDVDEVSVIGHSMGGMLGTRFSLMYPERVDRLVMVNPIGLEDWLAEGVPYPSVDAIYEAELKKDFDSIKEDQQTYYYDGDWNDEYARWARMLADTYAGEQGETVAWNHALTAQMVLTQPVLYQFDQLEVPTSLIIGLRDRTAIGRGQVDEDLAERLGDYPRLAEKTKERIPDAELIAFDDIGHMPQFEDTERYLQALRTALDIE